MLILALSHVALAGSVNFSPDRPGVGDSTGTPGLGHAMVEIGVAATVNGEGTAVGTSGIVGRIGLDRGLELRVRAPDLALVDGALGFGTVGLGAKIGGAVSDRWSVSLVPEVSIDPATGVLGGSLNSNVAFGLGPLGLWAHASASGDGDAIALFTGGGASVALGRGGVFVNGGHTVSGPTFGGLGGWWMLKDALQVDLGVDAVPGDTWTWLPTAGVSVGF